MRRLMHLLLLLLPLGNGADRPFKEHDMVVVDAKTGFRCCGIGIARFEEDDDAFVGVSAIGACCSRCCWFCSSSSLMMISLSVPFLLLLLLTAFVGDAANLLTLCNDPPPKIKVLQLRFVMLLLDRL